MNIKVITLALAVCIPMMGVQVAFADDDDEYEGFFGRFRQSTVSIPQNKLYESDCASCHMAYQPNLLPSASWKKLMQPAALADHFGDNAEVSKQDEAEILKFLLSYSADHKRSPLRIRSGEAPLRISELAYFKREHRELPRRMVQDNAKVGSFSNCQACHTGAEQGNYGERGIRIPGFGYWED